MAKHWHPSSCKVCGASNEEVSISQTGLCPPCGAARAEANLRGLVEHRGEWFEHWKRRCLAAYLDPTLLRKLLDETENAG